MRLCPGSLKADGPCKHGEFDVHPIPDPDFAELADEARKLFEPWGYHVHVNSNNHTVLVTELHDV